MGEEKKAPPKMPSLLSGWLQMGSMTVFQLVFAALGGIKAVTALTVGEALASVGLLGLAGWCTFVTIKMGVQMRSEQLNQWRDQTIGTAMEGLTAAQKIAANTEQLKAMDLRMPAGQDN